ncbi:hypothetical protein HO173_005780 [Letharia columbiana]|uniref:Nephrocystin 3-like N-terminal domain-containing protein n=1 Tax=Letharia columbiana TaxID=112416 RepID=A0A8H6L5B1_9LECA|nr:uncharacterized protein HO173_005780 [Letharia columbiana]KAF6236151.1 hypothetical protein HO173_005780 [Letharia columbiana]
MSDVVNSLHAAATKNLNSRLASWFSAPNSSSFLNTAQTKRQQDTGTWLLESPIFLGWKGAPHSFLRLHGKAGCGKTILGSTVLCSLLDDSNSNEMVACFYFDFQKSNYFKTF